MFGKRHDDILRIIPEMFSEQIESALVLCVFFYA